MRCLISDRLKATQLKAPENGSGNRKHSIDVAFVREESMGEVVFLDIKP